MSSSRHFTILPCRSTLENTSFEHKQHKNNTDAKGCLCSRCHTGLKQVSPDSSIVLLAATVLHLWTKAGLPHSQHPDLAVNLYSYVLNK